MNTIISDEEYSQMLKVRLDAKHLWEAGEATWEEYQATRAVVRRARKVRKAQGAVVENYKQQSAQQHQAMTRKATPEAQEVEAPVILIKPAERRVKVSTLVDLPDTPEETAAKMEPPVVIPAKRRTRKAKIA